jgi:hypothetical protein
MLWSNYWVSFKKYVPIKKKIWEEENNKKKSKTCSQCYQKVFSCKKRMKLPTKPLEPQRRG